MKLSAELDRQISAMRARLCARSPFFGSLVLFARVEASEQVSGAATDGQDIFINPSFFRSLSSTEQEAAMLHEVLHAALLHLPRGRSLNAERWNIAADIVVNGILANEGYTLPEGVIRDIRLERYSVEEVYDLLSQKHRQRLEPSQCDLLGERPSDCSPPWGEGRSDQEPHKDPTEYWRNAFEQAGIATEASVAGSLPADFRRELSCLDVAQLNWRHYLWRYLVRTPVDFVDFDRRFVGRGIYLDALAGEAIRVAVCVDTSGSIRNEQLQSFLSEVRSILQAYPHLRCDLYYADAKVHGPYRLSAATPMPSPMGRGGTDFRPFFERIAEEYDHFTSAVAVYLTDGYGRFPSSPPSYPVLWVVTASGLDLDQFPFGETVRLAGEPRSAASLFARRNFW